MHFTVFSLDTKDPFSHDVHLVAEVQEAQPAGQFSHFPVRELPNILPAHFTTQVLLLYKKFTALHD